MNARVLVVVLFLAAAGALLIWTRGDSEPAGKRATEAPPRAAAPQPSDASPVAGHGADEGPPRASERERVAAAADAPTSAAAADVPAELEEQDPELIYGHVLSPGGVGVPGLDVRFADRERGPTATTDARGRFGIRADETRGYLTADGPGWVTVRRALVDGLARVRAPLIVAARSVQLAGTVVDELGQPVAGARVSVDVGPALLAFPHPLDRSRRRSFQTTADESGRFRLDEAPTAERGVVVARRAGHEPEELDVPPTDAFDLVLELTRSDAKEPAQISGVVLFPDRTPAAEARVHFSAAETTSDAAGGFELPVPGWVEADMPLVAAMGGFGPAVATDFGAVVQEAAPDSPLPVTLVLGSEVFEIRGSVLGADGSPRAGWNVQLGDATEISRGQVPRIVAEHLAGEPRSVVSASDGAFRLGGLLPREYRLRAYDPDTLLLVEAGPFPAGTTDALIEVPEGALRESVRGRVESLSGEPVESAVVTVGLVTARSGGATSWTSTPPVTTDARGRFELTGVPRHHVHLDVGGDDVIPSRYEPPAEGMPAELVVTVARRCHFRVEILGQDLDGLAIQVADDEGETLRIHSFEASMRSSFNTLRLTEGTMKVHSTSEAAREVRVLRSGEVMAREPVTLVHGEVTEVRVEL